MLIIKINQFFLKHILALMFSMQKLHIGLYISCNQAFLKFLCCFYSDLPFYLIHRREKLQHITRQLLKGNFLSNIGCKTEVLEDHKTENYSGSAVFLI